MEAILWKVRFLDKGIASRHPVEFDGEFAGVDRPELMQIYLA
jgi:hypothetical protein